MKDSLDALLTKLRQGLLEPSGLVRVLELIEEIPVEQRSAYYKELYGFLLSRDAKLALDVAYKELKIARMQIELTPQLEALTRVERGFQLMGKSDKAELVRIEAENLKKIQRAIQDSDKPKIWDDLAKDLRQKLRAELGGERSLFREKLAKFQLNLFLDKYQSDVLFDNLQSPDNHSFALCCSELVLGLAKWQKLEDPGLEWAKLWRLSENWQCLLHHLLDYGQSYTAWKMLRIYEVKWPSNSEFTQRVVSRIEQLQGWKLEKISCPQPVIGQLLVV